MAKNKFHFLDDYRLLVQDLIAQYPMDEAMSRAVGGNYDSFGEIEKQALIGYGLQPAHTIVDVGCGSGRLVQALRPYLVRGRVLATDVIPELLDYARKGCPPSWQFVEVEDIRIPFADNCADFVTFFSVFTHLLHEESYCYLLEAQRVLKPGGTVLFTFLEYEHNWGIFESAYTNLLDGRPRDHLNMFMGRDAIESWSKHTGMTVVDIRSAHDPFIKLSKAVDFDDGHRAEEWSAMGQSLCAMRKDKPAVSLGWNQSPGYRVTFRPE